MFSSACVRGRAITDKLLHSEGRELRRALFSLKQIFQVSNAHTVDINKFLKNNLLLGSLDPMLTLGVSSNFISLLLLSQMFPFTSAVANVCVCMSVYVCPGRGVDLAIQSLT